MRCVRILVSGTSVSRPRARPAALAFALAAAACGGQIEGGTPSAPASSAASPGATAASAEPGTNPGTIAKGPEQLASDVGVPSAIAVTDDVVVFTTSATRLGGELVNAGALFVAEKRTGPALMLHVDRQGASFDALTVDTGTAFFATSDGRLLASPLSGGSVFDLAKLPAPANALVATASHVYAAAADGAVVRVARDGGAVEPLGAVSGPVRGLVADAAGLFAAVAGDGARGSIERIDLATRETSVLARDVAAPCAMAREGDRLFWTSTGGVLGLATSGGAPRAITAGSFAACAIATDGTSLFFATTTSPADGAAPATRSGQPGLGLMRAPTSGGVPTLVAGAQAALAQPGAVATDAGHLYWLTSTGVLRLRK